MKKVNVLVFGAFLTVSILLSSCNATMHTVGTGGKGNAKGVGQYDAKKKQWYLFFGLIPLNKVDSKKLAGDSQNYTVRTTTSLGDGIISVPGAYLLGLRSQTIRVSKGDN
jgi:hypothetical protein